MVVLKPRGGVGHECANFGNYRSNGGELGDGDVFLVVPDSGRQTIVGKKEGENSGTDGRFGL